MARITNIGIKKRKYLASDATDSPFSEPQAAAAAPPASAPSSAAPAPQPKSVDAVASTSKAASTPAAPVQLGEDGEPVVKKFKKTHRGTRGRKHKKVEKPVVDPSTIEASSSSSTAIVPPPRPSSTDLRPKGITGSNAGASGDSGWGSRTQAPTFNKEGRKTMAGLEGPKPSESQVGYEARVAAREARKAGLKSGSKEYADARALASEKRRLDRIAERESKLTCFACRGQGHSAKECPNALDGAVEMDGIRTMQGRDTVNICYRCGSTAHTLGKCPRPVDKANPMPHASCFVCLKKGHLASKCPQNAERGIYPDGGACSLCKGKDHLSRDCDLRKNDRAVQQTLLPVSFDSPFTPSAAFVGGVNAPTARSKAAGADEDDFHHLQRAREAVDLEERKEELSSAVGGSAARKIAGRTGPAKKPKVVSF